MFTADLFNERRLFPHIGGWFRKPVNNTRQGLLEFLYRATAAILHLRRMAAYNNICVSQALKHRGSLTIRDSEICFWSPTLVELLSEFSPYLSTLRVMQNRILPLTARALGLRGSIPKSLAAVVKKLDIYGFPSEIRSETDLYWSTCGRELKDFRDIDQHYTALVGRTFIQLSGARKVVVPLPDNPNERSPSRFTFDRKRDALSYFEETFTGLHDFVDRVAALLGFEPCALDQEYPMLIVTPEAGMSGRTVAIYLNDVNGDEGMEAFLGEDLQCHFRSLGSRASL